MLHFNISGCCGQDIDPRPFSSHVTTLTTKLIGLIINICVFPFQESPFFASGRLTWVDFLMFDLIETDLEFAKFDFRTPGLVQVNVLEKLPRLSNFYRSMAKLPRLAKHLSSKSRYPFKVPYWPSDAASKPT